MAINLPTPKNNLTDTEKTGLPVAAGLDNPMKECQIVADTNNVPELLVKASKDAELAKTAVRKAISQAFKEREESMQKAETLAQAFDEAIQSSNAQKKQPSNHSVEPGTPGKSTEHLNKVLLQKALTNAHSPQSAFADIIKTYFGNKPDTETKKDTNNPSTVQNKNLRQVIENIANDQVHKKAAKIIGEAKSDRIASKLVVNQAQDEIIKAREEVELIKTTAEVAVSRAREEADISRKDAEETINNAKKWIEQAKNEVTAEKKAAGLIASQAQHDALAQAAVVIQKAKDEVKAAKEAANNAIRLAKEEVGKSREEAETYRKNSQAAIAALEEKVLKVVEKVKAIKQQSLISISEAQAETQKANEAAEKTRRECQAAVKQAEMESQKAMEEAKLEIMKARETTIQSEKRAYDQVREKMDQVKGEAEKTRQSAYEAVARAREESRQAWEESRQARQEAEVIKKASEGALCNAIEEKRRCEEEAENTKQMLMELVNKAQEESRKAREEAEATIIKANDAMIKAQQDMIGMTINEISTTRQELEEAVNNPEKLVNTLPEDGAHGPGQSPKLNPDLMATLLHEMRSPLHSISGFARLMLDEDVTDGATRKEFLSIVVEQSENLTRLLDDLSGNLEPDNENPATDVTGQTA